MPTYDEVIQQRLNEIYNEVQDIDAQINELQHIKERRIAEFEMLQNVQERGLIAKPQAPKTDRIHIEDAVRRIFDKAGRPMRIGEIIDALEEFGFKWSAYPKAYYRLQSISYLQPTGSRGYYNFIR